MNSAFKRAVFKLLQQAIHEHGFDEPALASVAYEAHNRLCIINPGGEFEYRSRLPEEYVDDVVGTFLRLELIYQLGWDVHKNAWGVINGPGLFFDALMERPGRWYWWPCKTARNSQALYNAYLATVAGEQPSRFVFRIDGAVAVARYDGREILGLKATMGMKLLAFIIRHQEQEFASPHELESAFRGIVVSGLPDKHRDQQAKDALRKGGYRVEPRVRPDEPLGGLRPLNKRLKQIRSEIDEATSVGQLEKLEQLESEKEDVLEEVHRITSHHHRRSEWDPETKKILNRLRNCITRALRTIEKQDHGLHLAQHFRQTLLPFAFPLKYQPRPPIPWQS